MLSQAVPKPPRIPPGPQYHVLAKPCGAVCNLACTYCYYVPRLGLQGGPTRGLMNQETLAIFIKQYIEGQDSNEIVFSWQGGEPTMLGLAWFKRMIELQKQFNPLGKRIENDLQTNGIMLDDAWCEFLRDNRFLVGLSVDGPPELHDKYRQDRQGKSTCQHVIRAARLLHKQGVPFNTLTVVNRNNARHPRKVYRFLRDIIGSTHIQFIPCVEPLNFTRVSALQHDAADQPKLGSPAARPGRTNSFVTKESVDPDEWGTFLIEVFEQWYSKDLGKAFVYTFESALAQWMGMDATICTLATQCGSGLVMEHDGSIYSCDHFVYPDYLLGRITEQHLTTLALSQQQQSFGQSKTTALTSYCRSCRYLFACHGECPRTRFIKTPQGEAGLSYLCSGMKKYLSHIEPYMIKLQQRLFSGSVQAGSRRG